MMPIISRLAAAGTSHSHALGPAFIFGNLGAGKIDEGDSFKVREIFNMEAYSQTQRVAFASLIPYLRCRHGA